MGSNFSKSLIVIWKFIHYKHEPILDVKQEEWIKEHKHDEENVLEKT